MKEYLGKLVYTSILVPIIFNEIGPVAIVLYISFDHKCSESKQSVEYKYQLSQFQIRGGGNSEDYNDPILTEIQNVLCSFVNSNPEPWAPIICSWCLTLLGKLKSLFVLS